MVESLAGTLAGATIAAQHAQRELLTITGLREAGRAVCEEAKRTGCSVLTAASNEGAAVVGAALVMTDVELTALNEDAVGPGSGPVLVVDPVVVTRGRLDESVERLRAAGVSTVYPFACHDFSQQSQGVREPSQTDPAHFNAAVR